MSEYILKKVYPIRFKDDCGELYLQIYEDEDRYDILVNIVKYDPKLGNWRCIYVTRKFGKHMKFINHKWDLTNEYVLVLYENTGTGSYLTYDVLGCEDGDLIISYVNEDFILFGSLFFKENALIRVTCNQYWVWENGARRFVLKPYEVQKIPEAEVIEYSLEGKKDDPYSYKVVIDQRSYKADVNQVVQLIRKDFNDVTGNVRVWSSNDCMKFLGIEDGYSFKSNCKGTATIQLTSGAYNWDSVKNVKVMVE